MLIKSKLQLVTIITLVISLIHAQQLNPDICPGGPIQSSHPSWNPVPSRFEIMAELVMGNEVGEVSQAFSSSRDAMVLTGGGVLAQFYWNFQTNELFEIALIAIQNQTRSICIRQVIELDTSQTSTIQPDSIILKPSVLLGYDHRNQPNSRWGVAYSGKSTLRGIPTNVFKSCFYVSDIQATVTATYQVSDVTQFQSYLPNNVSMILQIDVLIATNNGPRSTYIYNVLRYTPNPSGGKERQALETPSGIFCPNRTTTLAVPSNLPDQFTFNYEMFTRQGNPRILSVNQLFDQFYQFHRSDFWFPHTDDFGIDHATQLDDFNTGLSYRYTHRTHQCMVGEIKPGFSATVVVPDHPNLVQMGDASYIFAMNDGTFQYTGEKQCREGTLCHVWISEIPLTNNTGIDHRESYWAFQHNGKLLEEWIPMKYIQHRWDSEGKIISSMESNMFNFRHDPSITFEINEMMADCFRAMGPEEKFNLGVISFIVANDKEYSVQKNVDYLRYTIWQTLTNVLQVRPFRISNVIVDHDGKDLSVTFTLLDASPRLGPVEFPLHESSLTTIIARLRTLIDSNTLVFPTKYDAGIVMLPARNNSLQVIYTSFDQNLDQCQNRTFSLNQKSTIIDQCLNTTSNQNIDIIYKSSGPLITGFWIGFIVLGIAIGAVGSFFVLRGYSKK